MFRPHGVIEGRMLRTAGKEARPHAAGGAVVAGSPRLGTYGMGGAWQW
jgi:hypothetical protein